MGSPIPFKGLNPIPDPSTSNNETSPATITLKTPKIEPKSEPLDEFYETHQPQPQPQPLPLPLPEQQQHRKTQDQFFPSLGTNALSNSQITHFSVGNGTALAQVSGNNSEGDNVFSEFNRISELFRTAFAKRLKRYGDVDVLDPNSDPDARAVVSVPQDNQISEVFYSRKQFQRSSELVRVNNLSSEDERYFRDLVKRTRMMYDSLRILSIVEEENKVGEGLGRRARGDLRAATLLRERGLWLNRDKRIVGSIPGVYVGDMFFFRMELCVVGLHGLTQAGIDYLPGSQSSNGEPIATSIIVSGGYEDDEDQGDVIIYTGHGGQDKLSRQCAHQKLEGGNLAMERSMHYGIEVRVIRGIKHAGRVSSKIYVYDGLYRIMDCWFDVGKSGFGVYKFKLVRIDGQPEMGSSALRFSAALRTKLLSVRPRGYFSLDISAHKENELVLLFNDIDSADDPLHYEYVAKTVFPPHIFHQNGTGCDCTSGCTNSCLCATKNGGEFVYDLNGFLLKGKPLVFECGRFCGCPPECRNRVTQKGLRNRLEVFRSMETGWGVRSLDLIHAGSFICEYTGVVLTREQAQILSMNGDSLVYPNRFTDRWAEWGDLSQIFPGYVRPTYPSIPPLDFAIDVSRLRNVACYMSHSTTPNVFVQYVLYDHNNLMFPHLMLFALENIPPLRELSLDYGVGQVADESAGKLYICN